MTPASEEPAGDDEALPTNLSKELEAVNAELARLTAENAELRRTLGEPISSPKAAPPRRSKRAPGPYRAPDPHAKLEEALSVANSAVASLGIDNSILQSRVDEAKPAKRASKVGRWVLAALLALVALITALAVVKSPRELGPAMLILVACSVGIYAFYGWFLLVTSMPRYLLSRRVRAQKVTPVASAPTGKSIVVSGVVRGRETAFEAWFPDGQRAVWQTVRVIEVGRRTSRILAELLYEADAFHVVDDDGGSVRIEPADAQVVPQKHDAFGWNLSPTGQQGLREIRGFQGDRDVLSVDVELVRLGASVLVEGRLSRDPDPVMRSTRRTPLKIVVLGIGGVDEATRSVRHGLRIGTGASAITVALCLAIAQLLTQR